jgi:hypothetical protein
MTETLAKIRTANPALPIRQITFWDDGTISASSRNREDLWVCRGSVDELCAALAETKVKTPEEKKAEEIAALEAKLAALKNEGK